MSLFLKYSVLFFCFVFFFFLFIYLFIFALHFSFRFPFPFSLFLSLLPFYLSVFSILALLSFPIIYALTHLFSFFNSNLYSIFLLPSSFLLLFLHPSISLLCPPKKKGRGGEEDRRINERIKENWIDLFTRYPRGIIGRNQ